MKYKIVILNGVLSHVEVDGQNFLVKGASLIGKKDKYASITFKDDNKIFLTKEEVEFVYT